MARSEVKTEIVWENPESQEAGATQALIDNLEKIKERPGEWARIASWEGKAGAYAARKRLVKREFHADFEFEVRKGNPGSMLYAKYRGQPSRVPIPHPPRPN